MPIRAKLFEMFTEMDLSTDTRHRITRPMKNMTVEQKRERVSRILNIRNTVKTEQELLQKLEEQSLLG